MSLLLLIYYWLARILGCNSLNSLKANSRAKWRSELLCSTVVGFHPAMEPPWTPTAAPNTDTCKLHVVTCETFVFSARIHAGSKGLCIDCNWTLVSCASAHRFVIQSDSYPCLSQPLWVAPPLNPNHPPPAADMFHSVTFCFSPDSVLLLFSLNPQYLQLIDGACDSEQIFLICPKA